MDHSPWHVVRSVGAGVEGSQGSHVDVGHQHGGDVLLRAGTDDAGCLLQGEAGGVLGVEGDATGHQGWPVDINQGADAGAADGAGISACKFTYKVALESLLSLWDAGQGSRWCWKVTLEGDPEQELLTCCGDSREVQQLGFRLDWAVLSHSCAHQRKDKQHLEHLGICDDVDRKRLQSNSKQVSAQATNSETS